MNEATHAPAGLGGWLWPITWVVAVLPVFFTATFVANLPIIVEYTLFQDSAAYPFDQPWAHREIGLHLLLTLVSWWWARQWFARAPQLPRQAPTLLLALTLLTGWFGWIDRHQDVYPQLAAVLLGIAIGSKLAARWSIRVRNTFTAGPHPTYASRWDASVPGGPVDWSRGRWLLPGALLYAVLGLCSEWPIFAAVASHTIPPPHPSDPANNGCGFGLAVVGSGYSMHQIQAHREALAISLVAGLLTIGALVGLYRGARWTGWIMIAALAMAMVAPFRITLGDWCSPYVDGPDFRGMWWEWCAALFLVIAGTAFRRWPADPTRTT